MIVGEFLDKYAGQIGSEETQFALDLQAVVDFAVANARRIALIEAESVIASGLGAQAVSLLRSISRWDGATAFISGEV